MGGYKLSRLVAAVEKFNQRDFFECHEILEDLWFDERGKERDLYHGLLHLAVGLHHLTVKNNFKGTLLQFDKALVKLEKFEGINMGIDVTLLKKQIRNLVNKTIKKEVSKRLPKIRMH
ncbi:MAG: DUF309 domain-containing protein [Ignavibacteria bacterium]|nr:DUF309 domain-containing protein [Ignavibacteria bacterium]